MINRNQHQKAKPSIDYNTELGAIAGSEPGAGAFSLQAHPPGVEDFYWHPGGPFRGAEKGVTEL
jgi:hypothetical protein